MNRTTLFLALFLFLLTTAGYGEKIPLPGETAGGYTDTSADTKNSFPFQLGGYIENTSSGEYMKRLKEERLVNSTRSSLFLKGQRGKYAYFMLRAAGTINRGAVNYRMDLYLPRDQYLAPGAEEIFSCKLEDRIYLQEAYGTLFLGPFMVRAGRQKFYTGNGYAYNPTDLFNRKNPLDPGYETDGIDTLLVTLRLPFDTEFQGLINFSERASSSGYLARIRGDIFQWEMAIQYTHLLKKITDYESLNTPDGVLALTSGGDIDDFTERFRWHFIGGEITGELAGIGIRGEGGYAFVDGKERELSAGSRWRVKDHERFLVSTDYTFDCQLYLIAEYLRLGQGITGIDQITFSRRMAFLNGEIDTVNKDTFFAGFSYPVTDLADFSFFLIYGFNDKSIALNPRLKYSIFPGCSVELAGNIFTGSEKTQNGAMGSGVFVRIKITF